MASIQEIASALRSLATPGIKPKALRAAVRERYPHASKKEIVRAAFFALADASSASPDGLTELHDFALTERFADGGAELPVRPLKEKKKRARDLANRPQAH